MKPGVHRLIARDGSRALLLVDDIGRMVELVQVDRVAPPRRPTSRWLAPSCDVLRARAEARRIEALAALYSGSTSTRYRPPT